MSKVLVLYYSAYGHIEKMAEAVAAGANVVQGTEVTIKRVPELVPEEIAKKSGMKLDQPAPIATVAEPANYAPAPCLNAAGVVAAGYRVSGFVVCPACSI